MQKKNQAILMLGLTIGLSAMTQSVVASSFADMKPIGLYPLKIVFTVDQAPSTSRTCPTPPDLFVTVNREHPHRVSRLELRPNSPYSSATILSSNTYDSSAKIRYFTDRVVMKGKPPTVMTLKGVRNFEKHSEKGTWVNNNNCHGLFEVFWLA